MPPSPVLLRGGDSFWDMGSFIVAVLALVITLWMYLASRRRKLLTYELVSSASIVNVNKDFGEQLRVLTTDDGEDVSAARILIVRLNNAGNEIIEPEDFHGDGPHQLRLCLSPGNLLRYGVQKLEPSRSMDAAALKRLLVQAAEGAQVAIRPFPLHPGDSLIVKLMVRKEEPVNLHGHIRGGRIEQATTRDRSRARQAIMLGVALFLAGFVVSEVQEPVVELVQGRCGVGVVKIGGSSALVEPIARIASEYNRRCAPLAEVSVLHPGSSGSGLRMFEHGELDLTVSELPAVKVARDAVQQELGRVPFVIIVHGGLEGVRSLTSDQLQALYAGRITRWSQLGGPDIAVAPYGRSSNSSGTRRIFEATLLGDKPEYGALGEADTTDQVAEAVASTVGGVGYVSLASALRYAADGDVRVLKLNGVSPSLDNVQSGAYPFVGVAHLYLPPKASRATAAFARLLAEELSTEALSNISGL